MVKVLHPLAANVRGPITQQFGENKLDYQKFGLAGHNGIDWGVPVGTPIRAMLPGRIIWVGSDNSGYGNYVKIDHYSIPGVTRSLYGHLSSFVATVGQMLAAGDLIGYSGNTGNSTGPHLHAGLRATPSPAGFDGYVDFEQWLVESLEDTTPTPSPSPAGSKTVIGGWNIRPLPSTNSTPVGITRDGARVDILGAEGDFVKVAVFIHKDGLK